MPWSMITDINDAPQLVNTAAYDRVFLRAFWDLIKRQTPEAKLL
jgi:hypothetical protein